MTHQIIELGEIIGRYESGVSVTQILEDALLTHSCLSLPPHTALPVCHSQAAALASSQLSVAAAYAAHCCRATWAIGSKNTQSGMSFSCQIPLGIFSSLYRFVLYVHGIFLSEVKQLSKRGWVWSIKLHSIQVPAEASKQTPRWSDKVKQHCGCRQRETRRGRDVCPVLFWWRIDSESECVSESGNECFC